VASGNLVQGNTVAGNLDDGIVVLASNNTIGGTTTGAGNVIIANGNNGVEIYASGVLVRNNYIGINAAGTSALGNSSDGVRIEGSNNTIGGTTAAARNVISGNGADGIQIGSSISGVLDDIDNLVQGNYIGTNAAGTAAVGNSGNGIEVGDSGTISSDGSDTTIGGTSAGAGNVISGNAKDGVHINSGVSGIVVQGNSIGTNAAGTAAVGNSGNGIEVGYLDTDIIVGGTSAGAGNVISGNAKDGVLINSGVSGTVVQGNSIGTNAAGTAAVGNSNGVELAGNNNPIGGTSTGAGNVISGNSNDGVLIDSGVSGIAVQGDYIGTNAAGTAAVANGNVGVEIDSEAGGITVGGTTTTARNVISGNTYGIETTYLFSTGVTVQGNYIGTNAAGNAAVGNVEYGIWCFGSNDTIGGTVAGARNVISGNGTDGILLDGVAIDDAVEGNYIGTNAAGTAAVANGTGIDIGSEDGGNTIGGTTSAARNIISGNSTGVAIDYLSGAEVVQGNFIGLNVSGNSAVGNSVGVEISGSDNTLGGTSYFARNYISGNSGDGVLLGSGASGNQVSGNFVGLDFSGKLNVGNGDNGIEVAGTSNTVGGTATGVRNVVSGNSNDGILLDSTATGNQVQGNYLGPDFTGKAALPNVNGIEIAGSNNTVGGTSAAARNIISGNSSDGVLIDNNSTGDQVLGNYVGTNASGTSALGNRIGIEDAGTDNILGGSVSGARNIVSGNTHDGVLIDSTATKTLVQGNFLGLSAGGNAAVANSTNGLEVQSTNNTIGGTSYYARNYISSNANDGVLLDSTASDNQVLNNFVGIDFSGKIKLGNSGNGIEVASTNNTLGGTASGSRNVISDNSNDGILLDSTATGTAVQGNYVGTDLTGKAALANGSDGVRIAGSNNTIGGISAADANIIAFNGQGGVLVSAGSGDTIRHNALFANGGTQKGPGITLAGGTNNNVAAPVLSTPTYNGTTLTVTGTFTAPTANVVYVLEFFANPTGDAEGKVYLGSKVVKPTTSGTQAFTFTVTTSVPGTDPLITATLTDASDDTSAFSAGVTS
jgi:hypothetical protein